MIILSSVRAAIRDIKQMYNDSFSDRAKTIRTQELRIVLFSLGPMALGRIVLFEVPSMRIVLARSSSVIVYLYINMFSLHGVEFIR